MMPKQIGPKRVEWQRDGRLLVNTTTGRVLGCVCNEYVEPQRDGYTEPVFEGSVYDNYKRRPVGLFVTLERAQGGVELEALGHYLSEPDEDEEELDEEELDDEDEEDGEWRETIMQPDQVASRLSQLEAEYGITTDALRKVATSAHFNEWLVLGRIKTR